MLALVGDAQALARAARRLPPGRELRAHPLDDRAPLARRQARVEALGEQAGDALSLAQQRAARRLGGMGREYRLDAQPSEQADHLLQRQAARLEAREALLEPARLRRAAVVHVLPAAADPVHLLCKVHRLEPGGERVDQRQGFLRRAALGPHHQFDGLVGVPLAAADGREAIALHGRKQLRPALVLEDVAHQRAEHVHVVAQRRVLQRKEDTFAGHGAGRAGGCRC